MESFDDFNRKPAAAWLDRGHLKSLDFKSGAQTQISCARKATYSSDNRAELAYKDDMGKIGKKANGIS
jgi:Zn-finger nucleic acid-binding protein